MISTAEFLINTIQVHNVALRLEQSIEHIKENNPHRTDLMSKMSDCKDNCMDAYIFLKKLEVEYRVATQRNFDLEVVNLNLKAEIEKLKEINANLLDNATL